MKAYVIFTSSFYRYLGTLQSGRLVWKTEEEAFVYIDHLIRHGYPSNYDVLEIEMKDGWDLSTSISSIRKGQFYTVNSNPIIRKVDRKRVTYFDCFED